MSYEKAQKNFEGFRARLQDVMSKHDANKWLRAPHPELGGASPARAIHSGNIHLVDNLVASLERK